MRREVFTPEENFGIASLALTPGFIFSTDLGCFLKRDDWGISWESFILNPLKTFSFQRGNVESHVCCLLTEK